MRTDGTTHELLYTLYKNYKKYNNNMTLYTLTTSTQSPTHTLSSVILSTMFITQIVYVQSHTHSHIQRHSLPWMVWSRDVVVALFVLLGIHLPFSPHEVVGYSNIGSRIYQMDPYSHYKL